MSWTFEVKLNGLSVHLKYKYIYLYNNIHLLWIGIHIYSKYYIVTYRIIYNIRKIMVWADDERWNKLEKPADIFSLYD